MKKSEDEQEKAENVFTSELKSDFRGYVVKAKAVLESFMAEKLWRMEVMSSINSFVKGENR